MQEAPERKTSPHTPTHPAHCSGSGRSQSPAVSRTYMASMSRPRFLDRRLVKWHASIGNVLGIKEETISEDTDDRTTRSIQRPEGTPTTPWFVMPCDAR